MRLFKWRSAARQEPARFTYEFKDRLPSKDRHFEFTVQVSVEWSVAGPLPVEAPHLVAGGWVRGIAHAVAGRMSVLQVRTAEQGVDRAVAAELPSSVGVVRIHRARVALSVEDSTLQAGHRLEHERQEQALESLRQERLRSRMRFLRDEVLRDPASARIYWLLEHPNQTDSLTQPQALDELVREVNRWRPQDQWVTIAQLLHEFVKELPVSHRERLVATLRELLTFYSRGDLAARLSTGGAWPPSPDHSAPDGERSTT